MVDVNPTTSIMIVNINCLNTTIKIQTLSHVVLCHAMLSRGTSRLPQQAGPGHGGGRYASPLCPALGARHSPHQGVRARRRLRPVQVSGRPGDRPGPGGSPSLPPSGPLAEKSQVPSDRALRLAYMPACTI